MCIRTRTARNAIFVLVLMMISLSASRAALACNCCATAGGGLWVQSGETLDPGTFSASAYAYYTQFEYLSAEDVQQKVLSMTGHHVHLHAARWSMLELVSLSYGISYRLEFGLSAGRYRAEDVVEGHVHGNGSYGYHEFGDIVGAVDPWIKLKYRLIDRSGSFLALEAGVDLPLGDDGVMPQGEDSNEPLEPSLQPGNGTFDFLVGTAYTRRFSTRTSLDASAHYLLRTENNHYKIGDALLAGGALSYSLGDDPDRYPRLTLTAEANVWMLSEDEEDGEKVSNSGGTTVFVTPGMRLKVSKQAAFRLAAQTPVLQDLNPEQQRAAFKLAGGVEFLF